MTKIEIETIFYDMMLNFVKCKYPEHNHWKIPGEEYVIRIVRFLGSGNNCYITISRCKSINPEEYTVDVGIYKIQKIIQGQMNIIYRKLYGSKYEWHNAIEESYAKRFLTKLTI